jgi:hypothetical protein
MKTFRRLIFILLSGFLALLEATAQDTHLVIPYYRNNFIFSSGFWVYQDIATQETDSITLENVNHGFYGPNPAMPFYREFYTINYYSQTNDSSFNDFFVENLWRVNGGGEWAELGQPVMLANNYGPLMGGYNGFEIQEIIDSITVGNNAFYNVARSHVFENQQYQHEFNYDMDLYYAEDVGIVRKAYFDDDSIYHSWELINWEVGPFTEINDNKPASDDLVIYPNPVSSLIRVNYKEPVRIEICNLQGEILIKSSGSEIDISNLANGIYLARIYSLNGRFLKTEKVFKNF